MNRGCIGARLLASHVALAAAAAVGLSASVMTAGTAAAAEHDLSWLWQPEPTVLEKPWALGAKPASSWRLEVVKPGKPAVINRSWPATVHLAMPWAKPRLPLTTGALPVSYTPYNPPAASGIGPLTGLASFYWQDQMTSSGERFDKTAMTAAHKTLPMHSRVRVTRLDTGRSVIVRINDRGPFKPGRIIDLSDAAAEALGMKTMGLAEVKIDVVR
jgi:rare lipoprotein A